MLAGEAVVAIWNGIAAAQEEAFYAWHLHEHVPERVSIPGFRRGRRYAAADAGTHPAYFTLYEADTMQVLQGIDYTNRLNAPTPWTRAVTAGFLDTSRTLARVLDSNGPGMGGVVLTVRFDAPASATATLAALVRSAAGAPRVTGAHLCAGDDAASGQGSAESAGRSDILQPPAWFVMVEATDPAALASLVPSDALLAAGARGSPVRGVYQLEYIRGKTAFA